MDTCVKGMEGCVWIHVLREWGMYVDTCVKGMEGCVWICV